MKGRTPLILRPDLLITEDGFALSEMDSVPGGIGLTAFLNRLYESGNKSDESGDGQSSDSGFNGSDDPSFLRHPGRFGFRAQLSLYRHTGE